MRGLARFKGRRAAGCATPTWPARSGCRRGSSSLRDQARGWDEDGLATAVQAVARADAEVKGAGADAAYSLERMVLTITGARLER